MSVYAISDPEIKDYNGVLHTLFQLEEMYGLTVAKVDGIVCLKLTGDTFTVLLEELDRLMHSLSIEEMRHYNRLRNKEFSTEKSLLNMA